MSQERIDPKNLESLLKFCLKSDDGKNLTEMDSEEAREKGEWLNKVLKEVSVNIGQRIIDHINILLNAIDSGKASDEVTSAIEELQDITENVDFAKVFIQLNGLEVIKQLIELDFDNLSLNAAELLANVTQNDEFNQTSAVNAGMVELLLECISTGSNGMYLKKMLYGLSCCVRGSEVGKKRFFEKNGVDIVIKSTLHEDQEHYIKAVFLLYCLATESSDTIMNKEQFQLALTLLTKMDDINHPTVEHLSNLILVILSQKPDYRNCEQATVLCNWLNKHIKETVDKPELDETCSYLVKLLKLLS